MTALLLVAGANVLVWMNIMVALITAVLLVNFVATKVLRVVVIIIGPRRPGKQARIVRAVWSVPAKNTVLMGMIMEVQGGNVFVINIVIDLINGVFYTISLDRLY